LLRPDQLLLTGLQYPWSSGECTYFCTIFTKCGRSLVAGLAHGRFSLSILKWFPFRQRRRLACSCVLWTAGWSFFFPFFLPFSQFTVGVQSQMKWSSEGQAFCELAVFEGRALKIRSV